MSALSDEMLDKIDGWLKALESELGLVVNQGKHVDRAVLAGVLVKYPGDPELLVEYEALGEMYRRLTEVVTRRRLPSAELAENVRAMLVDMDLVLMELEGLL